MTISSDRGDWRSVYVSFWDDPGVHQLSHIAYRVLTTLKGTLPAIGIAVVYDVLLCQRCGTTLEELRSAYSELERPKAEGRLGWIVREENIVWVVNALRFERSLNPKNAQKHRPYVHRLLAPFGDRRIAQLFRDAYPEWFGSVQTAEQPSNHSLSITNRLVIDSSVDVAGTVVGSSTGDSGETDTFDPTDRIAYYRLCVIALNRGMRENPNVVGEYEVATTNVIGQVRWFEDKIPIRIAEAVILEKSVAFRPSQTSKRVSSLKYFDNPVRARWAAQKAGAIGDAKLSTLDRARVILEIAKRYDLLSWNGNSAEYARREADAAKDPKAGPRFLDEIRGLRLTSGIGGEKNDHFAAVEIARRLTIAANGGKVA